MTTPPVLPANTEIAKVAPTAVGNTLALAPAAPAHPLAELTAPTTPISAPAFAPQDGPVFHSLFHTDRRGPVSLVVSELWGAKSVQFPERVVPVAADKAPTTGQAAPSRPLNLFQFLRPEIRGRTSPTA
jgi:hypothetical protein